ncbi:MAG: terpene cyclase/mutase family protein [Candidatus Riflebacteria bacterium]|nr:terpene cyclase/mutase family protein [Candidatus Riflebacteria bacterium]
MTHRIGCGAGALRGVLVTLALLFACPAPGVAQEADPAPRKAGQRGLDYLLTSANEWQKRHRCYGCHVQGVAIMGAALSKHNDYKVDLAKVEPLTSNMVSAVQGYPPGMDGHLFAGVYYAGIALAFYNRYISDAHKGLFRSLAKTIIDRQQPDGHWAEGRIEPPVDQGAIKSTASCLVTLLEARHVESGAPVDPAVSRAIEWLKKEPPATTQDHSYKIIGLSWRQEGKAPEGVDAAAKSLLTLQNADGGWPEERGMGSNAYATGMALYALKEASVPVTDPGMVRGTLFLLRTQRSEGEWELMNSRARRPSSFPSTMYAVVGLGGVFDPDSEREFLSLFRGGGKKGRISVASVVVYLAFPIIVLLALRKVRG